MAQTANRAKTDDALLAALDELVASLDEDERQPDGPTARLDRAVTRWSRDVAQPADVLHLVAQVRARTAHVRNRPHAEVLSRIERLGVAAVARRHVRDALTDPLTGLATRARMDDEVQHLVAAGVRSGAPLTAVMLDVDGLKQINDERGHLAGDEAIAEVGRAIRQHLRRSDRAFRYGGDEFALFLPSTTEEGARLLVGRIRHSCAVPVTAGVATHSGWALDTDVRAWLERADADLYGARRHREDAPTRVRRPRVVPALLLLAALLGSGAGVLSLPAVLRATQGGTTTPHVAQAPAAGTPAHLPAAPARGVTPVAPQLAVTVARPVLAPAPHPVAPPAVPVVVVVATSRPLPVRLPAVVPVPSAGVPTPVPSPGLVPGLLHAVGGLLSALL